MKDNLIQNISSTKENLTRVIYFTIVIDEVNVQIQWISKFFETVKLSKWFLLNIFSVGCIFIVQLYVGPIFGESQEDNISTRTF